MSQVAEGRKILTVTLPEALLLKLGGAQGISRIIATAGGADADKVSVSSNGSRGGWGFSGGGVMC